jgi:hypothetical protein
MHQTQPLSETTHLAIELGADNQMPVIWHQTERKQFQLLAIKLFGDDTLESIKSCILVKDRSLLVGPVVHVVLDIASVPFT